MALVQCSECNREISDQAAACPQCGHPLGPIARKTSYRQRTFISLCILAVAAIAAGIIFRVAFKFIVIIVIIAAVAILLGNIKTGK